MQPYFQEYVTNHLTGAALPGATVTVFVTDTATKANLFNLAGASIVNPTMADANGLVSFAANDGYYDIQIVSGAYTAPLIHRFQIADAVAARNAAEASANSANTSSLNAATSSASAVAAQAAAQAAQAVAEDAAMGFKRRGVADPVVANYDWVAKDANGEVFAGIINDDFVTKYAGSSARVSMAPLDAANLAHSLNVKQQRYMEAGLLTMVNLIMSAGQSFGTGTAARENLSRTPRSDCYMMGQSVRGTSTSGPSWNPQGGSTALTPMVATVDNSGGSATPFTDSQIAALPPAGAWGEDILQAAVRGLARGVADRPFAGLSPIQPLFVAASGGVGGTAIAEWAPNASPPLFNRHVNIIADFKSEVTTGAVVNNQPFGCPAIVFEQGQQDITIGTTEAAYISGFNTFQSGIHSQLASQFGQTTVPYWFANQTWGHYAEDSTNFAVPNAQLTMSWTKPEFILVGPDGYVTDNRDVGNAHPVSNGHRWLSSHYAKVMRRVLVERRGWEPVSPLWIEVLGKSIFIGFSVPEPPLRIKPVWVGLNPKTYKDYGIRVDDNGTPATIKSIGFAGATIVQIDLVNPLQGDFATQVFIRAGTGSEGGCLNIADSDPTISEDLYTYRADLGMRPEENIASLVGKPYDLSNYACCFRYPAKWSRP